MSGAALVPVVGSSSASTPVLAPKNLWKFLGERGGEPFKPFPAQLEALTTIRTPWPGSPYPRIFGVNCGRRFGKTTLGEKVLWAGMIAPEDRFGPPVVRVTADTEEHGRKIWDRFIWHLESTPLRALLKDHSRERNMVRFKNGANAQLLSANNPAALAGDGVTLWIIDESQYLTQAAWENLYPSTAERQGLIVMFGVSEGEGPFRDVCFRGDDPGSTNYLRLCYPTRANPLVPQSMIDEAAETLTPQKFKQLYLAQWVNELGRIFRNVEGCVNSDPYHETPEGYWQVHPPKAGHTYFYGLDLARLSDWTVFTIWDRWGRLQAWDQFHQMSWELSQDRILSLWRKYHHPTGYVDSTGVGDAVCESLAARGMAATGYQISSNAAKTRLVDRLAIRLGSGKLSFPNIREFKNQLLRYEAKRAAGSNTITYAAPSGQNDDWVMSAALACQAIPRYTEPAYTTEGRPLYGAGERHKGASEYV